MDIVNQEYEKDPKLRKEDVRNLLDWLENQPHLPGMTEQEIIWFLQSCYFSNEIAKVTLDNYFTFKTICPEILGSRDPKSFEKYMDVAIFKTLPQKTPDGSTVLLNHLVDENPDHFILNNHLKLYDMAVMLDLYTNGTHEGLRFCFDVGNISFGHMARIGMMNIKKFLFYLQDCMPIRLKGLHFFNITPVMDKLLMIIKPFLKKEVLAILYLHDTVEDMKKFIPLESLPTDYGGQYKSLSQMHDEMKKNFMENYDLFTRQDSRFVDEIKRPGKPKNMSDVFGVEGTFKKLDID